jgi:hypothetical protein
LKSYLKIAGFSIALVCFPIRVSAQEEESTRTLSVLASAGVASGLPNTIRPRMVGSFGMAINIGPNFAVGLQYDPKLNLAGTSIMFSTEAGFGQLAGANESPSGTNRIVVRRMPIMVWTKVTANAGLSPFIRAGAGVARTDLRETFYAPNVESSPISVQQWHFVWGVGGGLGYRVDPMWEIQIYCDTWVSEKPVTQTVQPYGEFGIEDWYMFVPVGLRVAISI